jgi:alanine-glyoxylate transaminase / serine-glyoxylate transaminase / serine-pyruvate transaminase
MSFVMNKPVLMIPGPTDPPEEVLRRCGMPVFPHYEGDFPAFHSQLVDKMKYVFGTTDGTVHIANGSGTTAVNMMLASLCTPDDSVLVVNNGSFGTYAERNVACLGAAHVAVKGEHGTAIDCDKVRDEMKRRRHPFIYVTHNESSTAIVNPLPPLGDIAREFDALLLVDSVSAVGGVVVDMDCSGADVAAGASQKCLELPPGLAPVAVGPRAWDHMKAMKNRRVPYVLDFMMWEKSLETRGDWHPQLITGTTTLLYALDWVADRIHEEGIGNRQERFRAAGERLKKGFRELGFKPAADPRYASPVVTEFLTPDGMLAEELRSYTMAEHNTMVARGERTNANGEAISFRVAHFGRAAEQERIDRLIDMTRQFMSKRD